MEVIYFIYFLAWAFILLGFYNKSYPIYSIGAFFLIIVSIDVIINGLTRVPQWVYQSIGIMGILISVYILLRGSYELYKDL